MKALLVGFLLIASLLSCKKEKDQESSLVELIPSTSLYIIDTPHIGNFLQQTDTLGIFHRYSSFFTSEIKEHIRTLSNYSDQKAAIIAINKNENEILSYVFIAKDHPGEITTDSVKNRSIETLTYKDFVITKYVIEEFTFFKGEKNGVFIASNSRQQLEKILQKEHTGMIADAQFIKAHTAIDREKTSLLLKDAALTDLITLSFNGVFSSEINLAHWNVLETGISGNAISLNGISTLGEGNDLLLRIFRNTGTHINEIANITPADSKGFYSFTYQDIDALQSNLNQYRDSDRNITADHFLHYTAEAGIITLNNDKKLPVLTATDPELAKELLIPMEESDSFRGFSIYNSPEDLNIFSYLAPLLPDTKVSYYIWIEDFIIFAENTRDLEQVISSYLNNMTLGKQEYYTGAMENLAAASSLLIVANRPDQLKASQANKSQTEQEAKNNYPAIALQFVVEKDFAHIHGAFGLSGKSSGGVTGQIATINLEGSLGTLAFPVKNHVNGQAEIIVQDEKNALYLYSSTGSLIWKKQFPHQIIGDISQIDLSKNGNLQYAFSTPYALHVIDRRGNPVKPFPLELRDEITQPLSIFDYDNNKTYRLIITQGNNVLMYDAKGRPVKGFDFGRTSSDIIQPPKHIRLNSKDFILIPESSGKLNIVDRQGKPRVEVKEEIDFSASPWFVYKNNFVSVSSQGKIIKIDETGSVSTESVGENGNIKIASDDKILVVLSDNTLKINNRSVNLDYGLYTAPSIFTSGNRTYISLTDTQAQRIYIFDENANLLPGFPLYGNSEIRMFNNGSKSNIFSVQGDDNEIIIYQF